MFLRLSVPPSDQDTRLAMDGVIAGEVGDPTYGTQLQDFAVPGLKAEGRIPTFSPRDLLLQAQIQVEQAGPAQG